MYIMTRCFVHLTIKEETKITLLTDCVTEYLVNHPEKKHMKITADKILYEVCRYYLENDT